MMRIHSTPDLGTLDTTDMTEAISSGVMQEFELVTHTPSCVWLEGEPARKPTPPDLRCRIRGLRFIVLIREDWNVEPFANVM